VFQATANGVVSSPVNKLASQTRRPSIVPASSSRYHMRGGTDVLNAEAAALRTDGRKKVGKELARTTYMKWHQIPDQNWKTKDGAEVIKWDPSLEQCKGSLQYRYGKYKELKSRICEVEGSLEQFALGYKKFGVRVSDDPSRPGIVAHEWAPGAKYLSLMGDFNGWNRGQYPFQRDDFGVWSLYIPAKNDGSEIIPHNSRYKLAITTVSGHETTRIPAWADYAVQAPKGAPTHPGYDGVFWNPSRKYEFQNELPVTPRSLRIYEAHVGMSSQGEPNINTYDLFRENVLPRIKKLG